MAKKKYQKSAACGTKSEKHVGLGCWEKTSRVHYQKMNILDQSREMNYSPNPFATAYLTNCMPDWIPTDLYFEMTDSLRGFSEQIALVIVDDLIDCWSGLGLHMTGISHVDDILGHLYARILITAFKKGIILMK